MSRKVLTVSLIAISGLFCQSADVAEAFKGLTPLEQSLENKATAPVAALPQQQAEQPGQKHCQTTQQQEREQQQQELVTLAPRPSSDFVNLDAGEQKKKVFEAVGIYLKNWVEDSVEYYLYCASLETHNPPAISIDRFPKTSTQKLEALMTFFDACLNQGMEKPKESLPAYLKRNFGQYQGKVKAGSINDWNAFFETPISRGLFKSQTSFGQKRDNACKPVYEFIDTVSIDNLLPLLKAVNAAGESLRTDYEESKKPTVYALDVFEAIEKATRGELPWFKDIIEELNVSFQLIQHMQKTREYTNNYQTLLKACHGDKMTFEKMGEVLAIIGSSEHNAEKISQIETEIRKQLRI